jgi:hypothetical protein
MRRRLTPQNAAAKRFGAEPGGPNAMVRCGAGERGVSPGAQRPVNAIAGVGSRIGADGPMGPT